MIYENKATILAEDENTLLVTHFDDEGEEIEYRIDLHDIMAPLKYKTYMLKHKIDGCEFLQAEDGEVEEWVDKAFQKFMRRTIKIMTFGNKIIETPYLN